MEGGGEEGEVEVLNMSLKFAIKANMFAPVDI